MAMSVSATLMFPVSTESQAEAVEVRVEQPASQTIPGSSPPRENTSAQNYSLGSNLAQDEVKVQIEPPGEIVVYKFLDQNGTLVLQVPAQQLLDLAQAINQELAQKSTPQQASGAVGGNEHGH
jgi:hypothetical protein